MGNTEETMRMKLGDRSLFCKILYRGAVPDIEEMQWPPCLEDWTKFLLEARMRGSSYKRFQGVVGNVCEMANRLWSKKRHATVVF